MTLEVDNVTLLQILMGIILKDLLTEMRGSPRRPPRSDPLEEGRLDRPHPSRPEGLPILFRYNPSLPASRFLQG